eukprot:315715_1
MKTVITLLTSLIIINNINCKTVEESSTGALLSFPSLIDGPLFNETYDVAPSQFGYQKYGGKLEAVLVLPKNETYHKECPADSCSGCEWEPLGTNPYIHYIDDWFISNNDIKDYILVIDRLDCYFVYKILHAQEMGASGVIMCDWLDEHLFTMWMPQDWKDNINIPSVLLDNKNCHTLMQHIGVQNWNPSNIDNMKYPSVENINWTIATIEWGLPHPDDRVEYELWTSSNDYLGSRFKHNFNTTAILLDEAGDTQFTPHMYILNGSHWGCDEMINGTYTLTCKQQCTNNGRYCAVDPEYDLSIGLNGMDVIQENLRSLCVWEYDKQQRGIMDDIMWWDYAVLWDENCGVYSNSSNNFHVNCSYLQMNKLDNTGGLATFVYNCINQSGGYGYHSGDNSILRSETKLKYNSSIYALPMVRVNEFLIHGNIDCKPPVTQHTCSVLAAICAEFIQGTQPDVCSWTPSPTEGVCNDTDIDCNGECFGHSLIDSCQQCLLISDPQWNECIGCNGKNETFDCRNICGSDYDVNPCGYCKNIHLKNFQTYGMDCNGVCEGTKRYDKCKQCLEESDPQFDNCVDCENIPNGPNQENQCGFCLNTQVWKDEAFTNYGMDCRGVCNGGFTYDECDNCLATSDTGRDSCVGCDKIPNSGKEFNTCGRCVSKSDSNFDDYGKDCRGICSSSVADTYYVDDCAKCLLPSDDTWNACLPGNTEPTTSKEAELTTVIVIVCIVAFLIVIAACLIIGALWKKQTSINARFDSLAATYVHMDENPAHNFPVDKGFTASTGTRTGMQTVPDDPESGEDE